MRARKRAADSTKAKAEVLESLIASLHDWPGVRVEKNVWLPAVGDPSHRAEIDVLLTQPIAGYPVRIAIECKNEAALVGLAEVNEFIGKLEQVGIPKQLGVFVSASGYTSDAESRAKCAGLRVLKLEGLSPNGLRASLCGIAHQSVVFLVAVASEVTLFTSSPAPPVPMFLNGEGRLCGTLPHMLAEKWAAGDIATTLGEYDLTIPIPDDWRPFTADPFEFVVRNAYVRMRVVALAVTIQGSTSTFALVDALTAEAEKVRLKAEFELPVGPHPLRTFTTEAELQDFLTARDGTVVLTTRIKVPRIRYHAAYWPLSARAFDRSVEIAARFESAPPAAVDIDFSKIEGDDICTAWEPGLTIAEFDERLLAVSRRKREAHGGMGAL